MQVHDRDGKTASRDFTIVIRDPLTIVSTSVPGGLKGRPYSFTLEATGGLAPYTWVVSNGSLPDGLALTPSGVISGTPTVNWYFAFYVKVKDSAERSAEMYVNLVIVLPLQVLTTTLFETNVGYSYSAYLSADGGVAPYQWGLTPGSGPLPPGLSITSDGWNAWIQGVPTQAGTYSFEVQVTDSSESPQVATRALSILVGNQLFLPASNLPVGVVGHAYEAWPKAYGGTPPYAWRILSGKLPTGLAFDSATGKIAGIPQEPAWWEALYLEVTDSSNPTQTSSAPLYLVINPPVAFLDEPLPNAVLGSSCSGCWQVAVIYGLPPYTMRRLGGALPPGLTLEEGPSESGYYHLSGTPTTLGQFGFTLEATDSTSPPTTIVQDFSITVVSPLKLLTTSLPEGWTGEPYTASLNAEGGVPPYFWNYCHDCIQPQLTVDPSSGLISGTPKTAFNQNVYFEVRDSTNPGQYDSKWLLLRIIGRLSISTSRLPTGRPDVPYRVKMEVWGGTPPYTWSLSSGSLPVGLALDPETWEITGTPTTEGTSSFTVKVTDTGPPVQTTSKALSLTIKNDLGRNDTIATATPISNGTFRASLSPYSDPVDGPAVPDSDYYAVTANPGAVVTVETMAGRLVPASPVDSVVEIVDAAGNRLDTCRPGWDTYGSFSQPCLDDDFDPYTSLDSKLYFQVPDTLGTPATFYVRVLDWSGNARPDFVYDLIVSGAN